MYVPTNFRVESLVVELQSPHEPGRLIGSLGGRDYVADLPLGLNWVYARISLFVLGGKKRKIIMNDRGPRPLKVKPLFSPPITNQYHRLLRRFEISEFL